MEGWSRMRNNIKLATLVFSKKNHAFWLTVFLLTFIITILFTVISILNFHQNKLIESRGNVYGYFYSIIYQLEDEYTSNELRTTESSIQVKKILENGFELRLGTVNPSAEGYVYRSQGSTFLPPLKLDSCAISESVANKYQKSVGDSVSILGQNIFIERIVPDIGLLWVRGEREENLNLLAPNVWLNDETFETMKDEYSGLSYRLIFLNYYQAKEIENNDGGQTISGSLYENRSMTRDKNLSVFSFSDDFYLGLLIVFLILFISIFITYHHYSKTRYTLYADLGLDIVSQAIVARIEYIFISLPSLLIGSLVAGMITLIFVRINYPGISVFSWKEYFNFIHRYALVYIFSVLVCLLFYSKTKKNVGQRLKVKKSFRVLPIKGKGLIALTCVLFLLLSNMSILLLMSIVAANNTAKSVEFHGQVKQNYDYELKYVPQNIPPNYYLSGNDFLSNESESGRLLFNYPYYNHSLDLLIPKIRDIDGVNYVAPFYENHHSFIKLSDEVISSPFISRVQLASIIMIEDGVFKERYFDKDIKFVVACDIFSFPDSYLKNIGEQVGIEDDVKMQRILDGDGVILISPSIRITEIESFDGGEGIRWKRSTEGDNLLKDEMLPDYEEVTIYVPQAKKQMAGIIPQEKLLEEGAELKKIDVPIISSSYDNLGWFPTYDYHPAPYRILASKSYLEKQNLNYEMTRVHVFLDEKADSNQIINEIHTLTRSISNLEIKDQHYNVKVWHEYKFMEKVVLVLYLIQFITIVYAFTKTISQSFFLLNENFFILYRDLGLTKGRMIMTAIKPFIITFFIGFIIQLIIGRFFWEKLYPLWNLTPIIHRLLGQFGIFVLYILFFALIISIKSTKLMDRQEYTE